MKGLNIGCGKHPIKEEGWVNVDHIQSGEVDKVMDVFTYPWDFPDNTFDEFKASHIVEHIPHDSRWNMASSSISVVQNADLWSKYRELDGFFGFFGEIWRIGKPGAIVHITTPYGMTFGAFQDPTHTRYMVPQSFAYLTAEVRDSPDFEYHVPCLYVVKTVKFDLLDAMNQEKMEKSIDHLWNVTRNMYVDLVIIK